MMISPRSLGKTSAHHHHHHHHRHLEQLDEPDSLLMHLKCPHRNINRQRHQSFHLGKCQ
jgi:hypothetical protein